MIGDPHATPGVSNERFEWLGKYIVDKQPKVIVCLGDFADMESLSSYDKGKKSFEGRRFLKDVEATIDAQERLFDPLNKYNATRRMYHEKQYKPEIYMLGGNHDEGRIFKACNDAPEYDGILSIDLLKYKEFGWNYVPYGTPVCIDGINYCHHFPNGNSKYPISGLHIGRKLLQKNHASSTVGHTHLFDLETEVTADRKRIWGLSAGCFFSHTPEYAGESAKFWWRGIIHKRNVVDGDYDLQKIAMENLKRSYA